MSSKCLQGWKSIASRSTNLLLTHSLRWNSTAPCSISEHNCCKNCCQNDSHHGESASDSHLTVRHKAFPTARSVRINVVTLSHQNFRFGSRCQCWHHLSQIVQRKLLHEENEKARRSLESSLKSSEQLHNLFLWECETNPPKCMHSMHKYKETDLSNEHQNTMSRCSVS